MGVQSSPLHLQYSCASHPAPLQFFPQGVACDAPVEGVEVAHGAGLSALVDGRRVVAGTPGMLASVASVAGPEIEAAQAAIDEDGGPVFVGERLMGVPLTSVGCLPAAVRACLALPPPPGLHMSAGATACFVAVDCQLAGWLR